MLGPPPPGGGPAGGGPPPPGGGPPGGGGGPPPPEGAPGGARGGSGGLPPSGRWFKSGDPFKEETKEAPLMNSDRSEIHSYFPRISLHLFTAPFFLLIFTPDGRGGSLAVPPWPSPPGIGLLTPLPPPRTPPPPQEALSTHKTGLFAQF